MATTTSNFSWPIPQSTDLVKDGATAIASLGSGIDTSMAELKGGTTGQILSKTSGTDMDFTWITPNPGDITGVTAGTGLTGGGTSGDVTVSIDPTYYLLANQTRRNPILNSNFSVWQRGTSATFSGSAATYVGADRWWNYGGATCTVSRQTADTTTQTYGLRFGRNSGQTNTTTVYTGQIFESINSKPYAGQTVTISFYAKKGADAPSTLNLQLYTGTGTDQTATQLFSGWTGGSVVFDNAFTVSTTMTRYSYTGTIASTANQIAVSFKYTPTGTAGANEWFQIEAVQLEIGSSATSYYPNGDTYQAELAACQRYYYRWTTGGTSTAWAGTGMNYSSTNALAIIKLPVSMRVNPTSIDVTATASNYRVLAPAGTGGVACSSVPTLDTSHNENPLLSFATAGSLVAGQGNAVGANSTNSAYIGFNAEL